MGIGSLYRSLFFWTANGRKTREIRRELNGLERELIGAIASTHGTQEFDDEYNTLVILEDQRLGLVLKLKQINGTEYPLRQELKRVERKIDRIRIYVDSSNADKAAVNSVLVLYQYQRDAIEKYMTPRR